METIIVQTKIGRKHSDVIGVVIYPQNMSGKIVFFKNDAPKKVGDIRDVTKYVNKDKFILAFSHKVSNINIKYVIEHGGLYKITTTQKGIVIDQDYCCMVDTIKDDIYYELDPQSPWENQLEALVQKIEHFSDVPDKDRRNIWVQSAHKNKKLKYQRKCFIADASATLKELAHKLTESEPLDYLIKLDKSLREAFPSQYRRLESTCSSLNILNRNVPKSGPKLRINTSFYVDSIKKDYEYVDCNVPLRPFIDLLEFRHTKTYINLGRGEIYIHHAEVFAMEKYLAEREDFKSFAQSLYREKEEEILSSNEWVYFKRINQPIKNVTHTNQYKSWDEYVPESEDGYRSGGFIRVSGAITETNVTFIDDTTLNLVKKGHLTGEVVLAREKEFVTGQVKSMISSSLLLDEKKEKLYKIMSDTL